jgi:hypothetical protein
MNEIYVREKIRDMLKRYGYDVDTVTDGIKCRECYAMVLPKSGRPDLKATWDSHLYPALVRPTVRIEVKVVKSDKTSFDLGLITDVQREGLTKRKDWGRLVYLALGVITSGVPRDQLAQIYLVPWLDWLVAEAMITPYQNSIPLIARKGMRRHVQDQKLDIKHLLQGWELVKLKKGWGIPAGHPAHKTLNLNGGQP